MVTVRRQAQQQAETSHQNIHHAICLFVGAPHSVMSTGGKIRAIFRVGMEEGKEEEDGAEEGAGQRVVCDDAGTLAVSVGDAEGLPGNIHYSSQHTGHRSVGSAVDGTMDTSTGTYPFDACIHWLLPVVLPVSCMHPLVVTRRIARFVHVSVWCMYPFGACIRLVHVSVLMCLLPPFFRPSSTFLSLFFYSSFSTLYPQAPPPPLALQPPSSPAASVVLSTVPVTAPPKRISSL
jgi:hypothetical protein